MARRRVPQYSVARGEVAPTFWGRADLEYYFTAAKRLENFIIMEEGGLDRRPGTRYVQSAKFPTSPVRLVGFQPSVFDAYMLEWGEGYIRVFKNGAYLGVEIPTPFAATELAAMEMSPSADTIFITHQAHHPHILVRYSDTVWRLRTFPDSGLGYSGPLLEYGQRPTTTVTPAAITGGSITHTASAAQFLAADVGRYLEILGGPNMGARSIITGYTSTTVVTASILDPYINTTANAAANWRLAHSPRTQLTPSVATPVGAASTLTAVLAAFRSTDVGKFVKGNGGVVEITGYTSDTVVTGIIRVALATTTAMPTDTWTLEEPAWSAFNGYPKANGFFEDRWYVGGTPREPSTLWGSAASDYGNFLDGGADDADPVKFPLSTGEIDFISWLRPARSLLIGTIGGETVLDGGGVSEIVTPSSVLARPTTAWGSAFDVSPIKVANVTLFVPKSGRRIREMKYSWEQDTWEAPSLLLLARHLTKGPNQRIRGLTYQKEPTSLLWAVREDGQGLTCAYLRDQNVVGWSRQVTDGSIVSLSRTAHPDGDRDQVWAAVARDTSSGPQTMIEYFDDSPFNYKARVVDSAYIVDNTVTTDVVSMAATEGVGVNFNRSGGAFTAAMVGSELRRVTLPGRAIITAYIDPLNVTCDIISPFTSLVLANGEWAICPYTYTLPHLAGVPVTACVDGGTVPPVTADYAGVITLAVTGVKVEIGRRFLPLFELLPPEDPQGTVKGLPMASGRIYLQVIETLGGEINGQPILYRVGGDTLGIVTPLYTGVIEKAYSAVGVEPTVTITQPDPLPMTIVFVSRTINVGT